MKKRISWIFIIFLMICCVSCRKREYTYQRELVQITNNSNIEGEFRHLLFVCNGTINEPYKYAMYTMDANGTIELLNYKAYNDYDHGTYQVYLHFINDSIKPYIVTKCQSSNYISEYMAWHPSECICYRNMSMKQTFDIYVHENSIKYETNLNLK